MLPRRHRMPANLTDLIGKKRKEENHGVMEGGTTFLFVTDGIDPSRVNILERWEPQAAVETFRGSGPSDEQGGAMLSVSVAEYDIADVRPSFGKGA